MRLAIRHAHSLIGLEPTLISPPERASLHMNNLSDEQLLQRITLGETPAFRQLYDRYGSRVLGLSTKIVGDRALAEEVTQETFWRIWRHAAGYNAGRGTFQNWMFGIARNLSIDMLRQHKRVRLESLSETNEGSGPLPRQLQDDHDVVESAWESLQQEQVHQALMCLPEEQRDVINWIYFQGKTRREIAQEQNIPFGTINTRASLALQKLRQALQANGYEFEA